LDPLQKKSLYSNEIEIFPGVGGSPREVFKEMKENGFILRLLEGCCLAKIPEPDGEAITQSHFLKISLSDVPNALGKFLDIGGIIFFLLSVSEPGLLKIMNHEGFLRKNRL